MGFKCCRGREAQFEGIGDGDDDGDDERNGGWMYVVYMPYLG